MTDITKQGEGISMLPFNTFFKFTLLHCFLHDTGKKSFWLHLHGVVQNI